MNALTYYDAARHALQIASSVDEVKDFRDKAQAMAAYARQANDTELVAWATEIKVRAERKAGQMLAEMPKNAGAKGIGTSVLVSCEDTPKTLSEMGISYDQSSRWQKLAAISDEKFEHAVAAAKEVAGEVTTAAMLRFERSENVHVGHNSGDNEWYTPSEFIESARKVMGGIDCDPASSKIANKTVKAEIYYTAQEDGLLQIWGKNVWLNPPYAQPLIGQFIDGLAKRFVSGEVQQACVLVNNATETQFFQKLLESSSAVCFPKSRIKFIDPDGNPSGAPLQGQALIYFGKARDRFFDEFCNFGKVLYA